MLGKHKFMVDLLNGLLDLIPHLLLLSQLELQSPLLSDRCLRSHLVVHHVPPNLLLQLSQGMQLLLEATPLLLDVLQVFH